MLRAAAVLSAWFFGVLVSTLSGQTADTTPPRVLQITMDGSTITPTTATFDFEFTEAVTGVDAADFVFNTQGTATATITGVTALSASRYRVNFNYSGTNGSVQIAIRTAGAGIADTAGNAFDGRGSTASGAITVNNAPPADPTTPSVISFSPAATASGSVVNFTLTFSEPVTGVDAADFVVTRTGTATATVGAVSGSGAIYTIPVTVGGAGTVQLTVLGGATANIRDAATNWYGGIGQATSVAYSTSTGTADTTAPTLVSFAGNASTATPTSQRFNLEFSEPVTGLDVSDFTIGFVPSGGVVTGTTLTGSGAMYALDVTYSATSGRMDVTLKSSGTGIQDAAGNLFTAGRTTSQVVDTTPPKARMAFNYFPAPGYAAFTLYFSEEVAGMPVDSFVVSTTGSATATLQPIQSIGTTNAAGETVHSAVVQYTGTGSIALAFKTSGSHITDRNGNVFAGEVIPGGSLSATAVIPVDTTPPTVRAFNVWSFTAKPAELIIDFSEAVSGVDISDFVVTRAGPGDVPVIESLAEYNGPASYRMYVNFVEGNGGGFQVHLKSSGTGIVDMAGNPLTTGATSPNYPIGSTDRAPSKARMEYTAEHGFRVYFDESIMGLLHSDFEITTTGTATASIREISLPAGSGAFLFYTLNLNTAGTGDVTVRLKATGTHIYDLAGNPYEGGVIAGGSLSATYTISGPPPTGAPTLADQSATATQNAPFSYQVAAANATSFAVVGTPSLPTNLSMSASGLITGTPTQTGTTAVTVRSTNAIGSTDARVTITVNAPPAPPPPPIVVVPLPPPPPVTPPVVVPPPVVKADQTISFNSPVSSIFVGQPTRLGATASSGLTITYTVVSGSATIAGDTITINNTEPVRVRAAQEGSANFNAASAETVLTAEKRSQSITLPALADVMVGASPIALNATTSSGLPVTLAVSGPATLDGNRVVLNGTAGTVTVTANQGGNDAYSAATAVTRTFNVRAVGAQVFFGNMGSSPFAASVSTGGEGIFVTRMAESGLGIAARFTLNANGSFSTQATPATTFLTGRPGAPVAAAGQTYTINGTVNNGVLSGTIVELGQSFTANIQPSVGNTAAMAGVYTAAIPGSASGDAYIVVGQTGQVYALAMLPSGVIAGSGTISSDGVLNLALNSGATIAGTIERGQIDAAVTSANVVSRLVGLSDDAEHTDRIVNLSSRLRVASGDASRSLIAGFVVTGDRPKRVLVRAIGPGLASFGVAGALGNPSLQIFNGTTLVAENNDWSNNAEVTAVGDRVGAFRLGAGSQDAAVIATLPPGAYTAVVQANGGSGVSLVEVYDADTNTALGTQQLGNISTRGFVDTGDGQLIAGFVVSGNAPKRVLIRGIGPGLGQFGVTGAVTDPVLKIYAANGTTLVAQNDDWATAQPVNAAQMAATAGEITAASSASGAFPLAANSKDAAIVITLMPGQYSAVVSGANNGTGAGLVEVYQLP